MNFSLFFAVLALVATPSIFARPVSSISYPSLLPRGYSTAPSGAFIVSKSPNSGEYNTIQSAINALTNQEQGDHYIYINAGIYNEAVCIDGEKIKGSLTIIGATKQVGSYIDNEVTITHGNSQKNKASNDESATLRVHMDDFKMYYINIDNSFGQGAQAVALSAKGNRQAYYGCTFTGFQDTILSGDGTQYFAMSSIHGATDIIFGKRGHAFFHRCDIVIPTVQQGWLMAPGGDDSNAHSFFVLEDSRVIAQNGASPKSIFLGRPWGHYAQAIVQSSFLSDFINPLGWDIWHAGDQRTQNAKFGEYDNQGPGNSHNNQRASFSTQLSSPITMLTVLGSTDWIDRSFIS